MRRRNPQWRALIVLLGVSAAAGLLCCGGIVASVPDVALAPPVTGVPGTTAPTTGPTPSPQAASGTTTYVKAATMPNLIGVNAAVADDQLRRSGLTRVVYASEDTNDTLVVMLPNWTITAQSTVAGRRIATDTLIVLTCTKGR